MIKGEGKELRFHRKVHEYFEKVPPLTAKERKALYNDCHSLRQPNMLKSVPTITTNETDSIINIHEEDK